MIIYEFVFVGLLLVGGIVSIAVCGKPLALGYAEQLKNASKEMSSEEATALRKQVGLLESRVDDLQRQLQSVQESVDFAIELKGSGSDSNKEPIRASDRRRRS